MNVQERTSKEERTLFDEPGSFMHVHHTILRGTNLQIGQQLGRIAIERHGKTPADFAAKPIYSGARRRYFQRQYPIHWQRTRGVAAAFGIDPSDDRYDFTGIFYNVDAPPPPMGCSVIYYPPDTTSTGSGYLSRNYDFSIGSMADVLGMPLPPEVAKQMTPVMCEPYLMVWYPEDGGYASLAIHAFDILSGTLDGINSAGLVVSIMADEEAMTALGPTLEMHPGAQQAVGLHELQVMRWLLDTCATADEARDALLTVKQYYTYIPCHYLVADRAGKSFVYENSTGRNVQHVIEGDGRPQVVTNFQLHMHGDAGRTPAGALTVENNAFWRYRKLVERIAEHRGLFTVDELKANNACVNVHTLLEAMRDAPTQRSVAAGVQARTLWHSLYDQQAGTAEFSFYLGDAANGTRAERRSAYLEFALNG